MAKLPPHNQRRLNVAIGAKQPGKTWFDVADELQYQGNTLEQITVVFEEDYAVKISVQTLHRWIKQHEKQSCTLAAGAGRSASPAGQKSARPAASSV